MQATYTYTNIEHTLYPKKYAHGFVVLCFVVVMQSFIMNSHEVFIHIHQGCFAGTGAIVRLPQCQWSKPDGYGKISQCITKTKHSKAKTVCIFLGIYCSKIVFLMLNLDTLNDGSMAGCREWVGDDATERFLLFWQNEFAKWIDVLGFEISVRTLVTALTLTTFG